MVNLASQSSAFIFFSFQALNYLELSYERQIFLLKSAWMNLKVFLLALKMMPLNSTPAIPVHVVLNNSHRMISPKLNINGSTS